MKQINSYSSLNRFKSFHRALCLANSADAIDVLSISYILTVYKEGGDKPSSYDKELLTASVFFGMLVGGIVAGHLADKIGRRSALIGSLALNCLSGFLSTLSPSIHWLIVFRVMGGVGVGGSVPVVFTLGAEIFPKEQRGKAMCLIASFWMVSFLIIYLIVGYEYNVYKEYFEKSCEIDY